jgi:hypothetical protein
MSELWLYGPLYAYPPNYVFVLLVMSFLQVSQQEYSVHFSLMHAACPIRLVLLDLMILITINEQYKANTLCGRNAKLWSVDASGMSTYSYGSHLKG